MLGRQDAYDRYLQREVRAYSPYWRRVGAAVDARPLDDFAELAPALVLRPDLGSIYADGSRRLAVRTMWARLWGGQQRVNDRVLVPRYKPVLWVKAGEVPIGYSSDDVQRLGRIGAHWLEDVGVRPDDVVVSVFDSGPDVAWWQVVVGARAARLSAMHLGGSAAGSDVAALWPTVVVGRGSELVRLADDGALAGVRLLLAVGEPLDEAVRLRLSSVAPVLSAWAPAGVRSLWHECVGGPAMGLHTTADSEDIELVDGEVVWSARGWRGTVLLRLRTGVFASLSDDGPCPACGRSGPRLFVADPLAVLDRTPGVLNWQAERRVVDGAEELIVFLAVDEDEPLEPLLRSLDAHLSAAQLPVTQFVVAT